jgi:hypothetical protein
MVGRTLFLAGPVVDVALLASPPQAFAHQDEIDA